MLRMSFLLLFGLSFCADDETLTGYGAAGSVWKLASLNGADFTADATLEFGEEGAFFGKAPCNSYRGNQTADYPWFEAGPIAATQMACPDLEAEGAYLSALSSMTIAEVVGDTMILSNETGGEMVFEAQASDN